MPTETAAPRPALTTLSDEEVMFRAAVSEFAELEVRPRVHAMERAGRLDPALIPQYFSLGLMGIEVPEQYGGAGGSLIMVTLAVEAISRVDASAAIMVDVQNTLVNYPIARYGSDDIKARYLPRLTSETVGAYALSEASSGSDAFGLQTTATRVGDHYVLNGRKMWITNGAEAEIYVVFANVDRAAGYKGITAFVVERGFPGFRVGKKEDKLGIRASSTVELLLDSCEVPVENVLGPAGQGYKIAIETLNEGRIGIGAQMIGVADGALSAATAYIKERKQFGKVLAGYDIAREGAMAKLFASQVCERVTSRCVELFGGYGYTTDYPVEKFYRDAKIGTIYEGTSNMQLQTIAKAVLR